MSLSLLERMISEIRSSNSERPCATRKKIMAEGAAGNVPGGEIEMETGGGGSNRDITGSYVFSARYGLAGTQSAVVWWTGAMRTAKPRFRMGADSGMGCLLLRSRSHTTHKRARFQSMRCS